MLNLSKKTFFSNFNEFNNNTYKITNLLLFSNRNIINSKIYSIRKFYFSLYLDRSRNYFFKKQEYDREYKYLTEEMKNTKSILIYSRKIPFYNINFTSKKFFTWVFGNCFYFLLYSLGLKSLLLFWISGNSLMFINLISKFIENYKSVSSIFLIKTQNDFTNDTEFYFIIGYSCFNRVKIINLINFDSVAKAKIDKKLCYIDDNKVLMIGSSIDIVCDNSETFILNRDVFKHFFKQDKYMHTKENQNSNKYEENVNYFLLFF